MKNGHNYVVTVKYKNGQENSYNFNNYIDEEHVRRNVMIMLPKSTIISIKRVDKQ